MTARVKISFLYRIAIVLATSFSLSNLSIMSGTSLRENIGASLKENDEHAMSDDAFINAEDEEVTESNLTISSRQQDWWRGNNAMALVMKNLSHPHLGAMHPSNGTYGMIVDPSPLRLQKFDSNVIHHNIFCPPITNTTSDNDDSDKLHPICIEGEGGNKVLQKIKRGMIMSQKFLELQHKAIDDMVVTSNDDIDSGNATNMILTVLIKNMNITARARRSKILCMVYTVHLPPHYKNSNLRSQAETWGRQCDGFIAASNFTDHAVGAVDLSHRGPETYGNMWQKVTTCMLWLSYLDGPEVTQPENGHCTHFYKKCTWTPDKGPRPLYFGTSFLWKGNAVAAGGPGYTLNRAALDILVEDILPMFFESAVDSREDLFIGSAFAESGILLSWTDDANGGKRYGGSAQDMFSFNGKPDPTSPQRTVAKFGLPPLKSGINGTSEQFISAHLKNSGGKDWLKEKNCTITELMYRYHAILNDHWYNCK